MPHFRILRPLLLVLLVALGGGGVGRASEANALSATWRLNDRALTLFVSTPHFLLPPAADLSAATIPALDDPDPSAHHVQQAADRAIEAWLAEQQPVLVDGQAVAPLVTGLQLTPVDDGVYLGQARRWVQVEFSVSYALDAMPHEVRGRWALFPMPPAGGWPAALPGADPDPAAVVLPVYEWAEPLFKRVTPTAPDWRWQAGGGAAEVLDAPVAAPTPRTVPAHVTMAVLFTLAFVLAGVCLAAALRKRRRVQDYGLMAAVVLALLGTLFVDSSGARDIVIPGTERWTLPTDAEAETIFKALHANIYRALEGRTEEAIYDGLAKSVDGSLLVELYTETYKDLVLQDAGGAKCRIESVDVTAFDIAERHEGSTPEALSVRLKASWQVAGYVDHWGHVHRRLNAYTAMFTLAPADGHWKIRQVDVLSQEALFTGAPPPGAVPGGAMPGAAGVPGQGTVSSPGGAGTTSPGRAGSSMPGAMPGGMRGPGGSP